MEACKRADAAGQGYSSHQSEKKFQGVSDEVERPETEVIADELESQDNVDLREGSDENDDYVSENDVDNVRHNEPGLKEDWPMKI